MIITPDHLTKFKLVEALLIQAQAALRDDAPRIYALGERGPLITPDFTDWQAYDQGLENDLKDYLEMLSDLLKDISWEGPQLPEKAEHWIGWLDHIRKEITRYITNPNAVVDKDASRFINIPL